MKIAVIVTNTIQTGVESYKDVKQIKVFEDTATILEIKQWIREAKNFNIKTENINISHFEIVDVVE